MSIAYLNEGATSFAAANWSDASGVINAAELVIDKRFGRIATDLNFSAIDVLSFVISQNAVGVIGGDSVGPLLMGADNVANTALLRNYGFVELYYSGDTDRLDLGGGSRNYIQGGTHGTVTISGGYTEIGASAIATTVFIFGGSGTIAYNATDITNLHIFGGNWVIQRPATNMFIGANATVRLDYADNAVTTGHSATVYGGNVSFIFAAIPTITAYGGMLDFSVARRAFDAGATLFDVGAARIKESPIVDLTNVTYIAGFLRTLSGGAGSYDGGSSPTFR